MHAARSVAASRDKRQRKAPLRGARRSKYVRPVKSPTRRPLEPPSGTSLFPGLFPNARGAA